MKKMLLAGAVVLAAIGAVPAQAGSSAYSGSILAEDATVEFKVVKKRDGSKKVKDILVDGIEAECEGEEEPVPLRLEPGGAYKVKKNKFKVEETEPFVLTFRFEGTLKKRGKAMGTTEFFGDVGGFGGESDVRYCEASERLWTAGR